MTVYDGAVRIQDKDGRDVRPWRVPVYVAGTVRFETVVASSGLEAARRAHGRWTSTVPPEPHGAV